MRWALLLLCCYTQAEHPVGADAITYLDDSIGPGSRDDGFTIPASVPGGVVADLQPPARSATCWTTISRATPTWNARGRSDDL